MSGVPAIAQSRGLLGPVKQTGFDARLITTTAAAAVKLVTLVVSAARQTVELDLAS
jgi:hypothetical protein